MSSSLLPPSHLPGRGRTTVSTPGAASAAATTVSPTPTLKSRIAAGETLYGLFLLSSNPTLAEIAGLAGYDYAVVDMEHGPGGISDALPCLRVLAATGTAMSSFAMGTRVSSSVVFFSIALCPEILNPQFLENLPLLFISNSNFRGWSEDDTSYTVRSLFHGYSREDLRVTVVGETLVIKLQRHGVVEVNAQHLRNVQKIASALLYYRNVRQCQVRRRYTICNLSKDKSRRRSNVIPIPIVDDENELFFSDLGQLEMCLTV